MACCTYCGSSFGGYRDHLIPVATKAASRHYDCETVPSCAECNALLGSKLFMTIQSRAAYLLGAVERRYKKVLSIPVWTEDELDDLGPTMRRQVEASLYAAQEARRRLDHLELVALTGGS